MAIEFVTREEREQELLQKAKIVFISGQLNIVRDIAFLLERRFFSAGILSSVIDSDRLLNGICSNCKNDESEILRLTIETAKLFLHTGIITICYGIDDSINTVNKLVNNSDLIVVTTSPKTNLNAEEISIEIGEKTLEDIVHHLYKKLAVSISE